MTKALPYETRLRNGERVLIREIGPADRPLLRDGFARLSEQSRFFRFLGPHKALSEAELDQFSAANNKEHFAIGAAAIGVEADLPLGTTRFVRLGDSARVAEMALTIIDSHQRLGLGAVMFELLADAAQAQGIETLTATVHRENHGMQALLQRFGGRVSAIGEEREWQIPLPLPAKAPTGHIAIPPALRR